MPPKKTRASATPQPEPQRPVRASGRRRQSDASNISETPSSSQIKTPGRRGRGKGKSKAQPEVEVIVENDEQAMEDDRIPSLTHDDLHELRGEHLLGTAEEEIQVSQTSAKQVHFGTDIADDEVMERATATNITPHVRKMTVKRRRSDSPSVNYDSVKRVKSSRTSLPPTLSQEEPTQVVHEYSFASLAAVLAERMRRFSGKHTADSQLELDAQMDGAADLLDDDMLVLDAQNEITITQLPSAPRTLVSGGDMSRQQVTVGEYDRAQWTAERKQFHDAILALQQDADEARGQLRILDIELESMDFAAKGTPSLEILQSIRDSQARLRAFLETSLPDALPEGASNEDLTEIVAANLQDLADRLRTSDQELEAKDVLIKDFTSQINGLLDRLATKEIEQDKLHNQLTLYSQTVEGKNKDLLALGEDLDTAEEERVGVEKQRDDEIARADKLVIEKSDLEINIERLSVSLQAYQSEETLLTEKINRMEEEHRDTVSAMNREREDTVRALEDQLDGVATQRQKADALAASRQVTIEQLEVNFTTITAERDDLQKELDATIAERDDEISRREQEVDQRASAEAELEQKDAAIDDLELRVKRLDEELDDYNQQMEELRSLNEQERHQRVAAETDLDTNAKEIEDLHDKLREQGKQANELRLKLFEVQTENDRKVKDLETAASERDLQFQDDMAVEISRREDAEGLAQERAATIKDLEQQLEALEEEMRDVLAERDAQIVTLQDEASQKDAEIQNLQDTLQGTETEYVSKLQQHRIRIASLEDDVVTYRETITNHETTIRNLEQQAEIMAQESDVQIEDRDAKIAFIDNELTIIKVTLADLEKDKAALERKVAEEAEFLLTFQNDKNAEVEELKQTIRDKQLKITTVEEKARETDRCWQDVLAARDEEIQTLTTTQTTQTDTIVSLRQKFRDYVRRSSGFIAQLQEKVDAAKGFVDGEGGDLVDEGEELLAEFEAEVVVESQKTTTTTTSATKKKKKREFDSAIGMEGSPAKGGRRMMLS